MPDCSCCALEATMQCTRCQAWVRKPGPCGCSCSCTDGPVWHDADRTIELLEKVARIHDDARATEDDLARTTARLTGHTLGAPDPLDLPAYLVFGGRTYLMWRSVWGALDMLRERKGDFVLHHGACHCGKDDPQTGADRYARDWAQRNGITHVAHPADWTRGGTVQMDRSAGPERNAEMAALPLAGAVGFPGGPGTLDMERRLQRASVRIWWPAGGASVPGL